MNAPSLSTHARLLLLTVACGALALLAAPTAAHGQSSSADATNDSTRATPVAIERVASKHVCMITDKRFEEEQIPVPIEDKTYYGCCQGCVRKLNEHPESRTATDPVTGNEVNKAEAVLGALPSGAILYFESEQTMRRYDPSEHGDAGEPESSDA